MGTLGAYLREARETLGIDLREAAQRTRIAFNYLKAIEEEDFNKLPGEVFVKGFLKNYARFLGLSEDDVMRRYAEIAAARTVASAAAAKTDVQKPAETPSAAPAPATASRPSLTLAGLSIEPYLWAGVLVIALIAFIVVALPRRQAPSTKERTGPALTTTTTTVEAVPAARTAVVPEKLYLDILALEDVWVLIRTDASPQKKAVLKQGETVTWSAEKRFVISYGSAGAAKLVLNGKELAVPGAKDAVVRDLMITASGVVTQKTEPEQPKPRKSKPIPSPAVQQQPTVTQPQQERSPVEPLQQDPAPGPAEPSLPAPPTTTAPSPETPRSPFE
jgi:cytoskeletal protein RodZ